jgi:LuxR family transcriptional regulator, maltose regulon positive regulatory protein
MLTPTVTGLRSVSPYRSQRAWLVGDPPDGGVLVARSALFQRLAGAARVTIVSAPAGSGKTLLLRSWIAQAGLTDRMGWVTVPREERDPQRFWIAVLDALRGTGAGSCRVGALTPAPRLDGGVIVERLLEDLHSLGEPIWLVVDDVHELAGAEVLRQLGVLVLRSSSQLRFVLATRRDLRLGLHRLRLEGDVTEIGPDDLKFTLAEARALFELAGVALSDSALALLHERTEGWAAGLRLAALSLAGHPDPERFAAEFRGSERTVAEYLLHEVLERQPDEVRQMLLRTSVLDRVNGPVADLLTGGSGTERILQELEDARAFVVSLDGRRSWFRYHPLFADLLQLELRRTAPDELRVLHRIAAAWFGRHDEPVAAVRHAQQAGDWEAAARVLSHHWFALWVSGQTATANDLLAGFPDNVVATDARLLALVAGREVVEGSLAGVERYVTLATRRLAAGPANRRAVAQALLAVMRLRLARQRGDLSAVVGEAKRLLAPAASLEPPPHGLGGELRAVALLNLGIAEIWADRPEDADRHLEYALVLARRARRPYVEISCLANRALALIFRSFALAKRTSLQAIEDARKQGWADEPIVGIAYAVLGGISVWQGRLDEAQRWLGQAQRALRAELEPAEGLLLRRARGMLELARGREQEALVALRGAACLDELLCAADAPARAHALAAHSRALTLQAMLRLGETERVEQALTEMDQELRESSQVRTAVAALRLSQHDPEGATAVLAPAVDGSARYGHPVWLVEALLLDAIARDTLGDGGASGRSLERALDLAEPDGVLWPFLVHPEQEMLERHEGHRTTHASLISEILGLLAGKTVSRLGEPEPPVEPLSESETRVLRYLPTNLSGPEIANELELGVTTVRTHVQRIYTKLGVHRRADAVERARGLGLLAPSSFKPR